MALLSKKAMNFAYGMGAAVVIVGALFKIIHFELGPLTGTRMLAVGLLTEAFIFALGCVLRHHLCNCRGGHHYSRQHGLRQKCGVQWPRRKWIQPQVHQC